MKTNTIIRFAAALLLGAASLTAFAAQRTFVASYGLDTNPCTLVSPCRTFTAAIAQTDINGEVIVLDSAGYGAFTITKSVSVIAPDGVYAGISVFSGQDGVTVSPGPTGKVVMRGLVINGQGGSRGIVVQNGEEVHIENCVVSNLLNSGISIAGGAAVHVTRSIARSNGGSGIHLSGPSTLLFVSETRSADNGATGIAVINGNVWLNRMQADRNFTGGLHVEPTASATVHVLVRDSEFSGSNGYGIGVFPTNAGSVAYATVERSTAHGNALAGFGVGTINVGTGTLILSRSVANENSAGVTSSGSNATAIVGESMIARNYERGLGQSVDGVLVSCGNNMLMANTTATSGVITQVTCNQ